MVALVVALLGSGLDWLFQGEGIPVRTLLTASNALTGVATGGLFWAALGAERREQEAAEKRLRAVAEINRQLQSSLQVLSYLAGHQKDETRSWLVRESARHIEWTLHAILPDVGSVSNASSVTAPSSVGPEDDPRKTPQSAKRPLGNCLPSRPAAHAGSLAREEASLTAASTAAC
jgi:hypothetical protein